MAVGIDKGDLPKIAKNYGQAGRPMPDWVRDDPALISAYDQGTGRSHPLGISATTTSSGRAAPAPVPAAPSPAAGTGTGSKKPRKQGYVARGFSPSAAVGRTPVGKVVSAGDGGGLFLAFILWPIMISVLKNGPAGLSLWFRAKWLNETAAQPNNLSPVIGTAPGAGTGAGQQPGTPTVTLPRPPGWVGTWPPPGTYTPTPGTTAE